MPVDPRVQALVEESHALGYECGDMPNGTCPERENRIATLAADLSAQMMTEDARERVAKWLALNREDIGDWSITCVELADSLLAALRTPPTSEGDK